MPAREHRSGAYSMKCEARNLTLPRVGRDSVKKQRSQGKLIDPFPIVLFRPFAARLTNQNEVCGS